MVHANTAGEEAGEPACIAHAGRLGRSSFAVNAPRFTAKLLSEPGMERRLRDAIAIVCGAQVDWHGI